MATKYRTDSYPYKVYTALLTQSGGAYPTATVLENTLSGDIVWTRSGAGYYIGTLTGEFTADKVFIQITMRDINTVCYARRLSVDAVDVITFSISDFSGSGPIQTDDCLTYNSIEIRVYN